MITDNNDIVITDDDDDDDNNYIVDYRMNNFHFTKELKYEGDSNTYCSWCTWKKIGGIGNLNKNRNGTALIRSARILRRFLETWVDLLSLGLQ